MTAADRVLWRTLALVVLLPLGARIILMPLGLDYGFVGEAEPRGWEYPLRMSTQPMDFNFYSDVGERIIQGKAIYTSYSLYRDTYQSLNYPPGFPLALAAATYLFGVDFLAYKAIAVAFDVATAAVIFLVGRRLLGDRRAAAVSLLYSLAYLPMLSSGIVGNDDHGYMFFSVLSVHLAMNASPLLAALSLAAAGYFKASAVLFAIPLGLYAIRRWGFGAAVKYCLSAAVALLALLAPFIAREGPNVFNPYTLGSGGIDGLGVLNLARLTVGLPYHLAHPEVRLRDHNPDDPMNALGENPFMTSLLRISLPLNAACVVAFLAYATRRRLADPDVELIRNIVVFSALEVFVFKVFYDMYYIWFLPFILLVFAAGGLKSEKLGFPGPALVLASVVGYGLFFGKELWQPLWRVAALCACSVLAVAGSWLALAVFDRRKRMLLSALTAVMAYFELMNALPWRLLYPLVSGMVGEETFRTATYYGGYYALIVCNAIVLYHLLREVHRQAEARGGKARDYYLRGRYIRT